MHSFILVIFGALALPALADCKDLFWLGSKTYGDAYQANHASLRAFAKNFQVSDYKKVASLGFQSSVFVLGKRPRTDISRDLHHNPDPNVWKGTHLGYLAQMKLFQFAGAGKPDWILPLSRAHGIVKENDALWVSHNHDISRISMNGEMLDTWSDSRFARPHNLAHTPQKPGSYLLPNSAAGELLEVNPTARTLRTVWSAWQNGYSEVAPRLHLVEETDHGDLSGFHKVIQVDKSVTELPVVPDGETWALIGNISELTKNREFVPMWTRTTFPNYATYTKEGDILATFLKTGELVKINKESGQVEVLIDGLLSPHGVVPFQGDYFVTNTGAAHVIRLDENFRLKAQYGFHRLPRPRGAPKFEWLQHTFPLDERLLATIDARRQLVIVWDPEKELYNTYPIPNRMLLQAVHGVHSPLLSPP